MPIWHEFAPSTIYSLAAGKHLLTLEAVHELSGVGVPCAERSLRQPSDIPLFDTSIRLDDMDAAQSDHIEFGRCSCALVYWSPNYHTNRKPAMKSIFRAVHQYWSPATATQVEA